MDLEFYYDVVCPYAYLASTRIEALAAKTGATLHWRPVLLGGLFRHVGADQNPGAAMGPAKARLNLADMSRFAAMYGVPLEMPAAHPRRSVEAMRLLVAAPESVRPALTHALYRAYWVEGRDIADRAVLGALAAAHGLSLEVIDAPAVRDALFAETAAAAARGLFGVPAFGVGDRIFWGQDRMHLVERALTGAAPEYAPPSGAAAGARVTLYHDFASPFAYLAATQAERILGPTGAELLWRPILLGALFRDIGTPDVPLMAMNEARRRYFARDLHDWAEWWGVPFRFPDTFPIRTVLPLRVALLAPEATPLLYRAAWAENRDIGDAAVLAAVLDAAGFPGASLVERAATDPDAKAALRANTDAARAVGACGVPTFVVERADALDAPARPPEVFWGQDRFELVMEALCR
jgi:2-hydroxychromene-2-carboxylate isomerase